MNDEYISWAGNNFRIRITIRSKFKDQHSPQSILNGLIDKHRDIERKERTDRLMWPDKELTGVKFDISDKGFKGNIKSDSISLTSKNISNIDELYSMVYDWTNKTDIHLPPISDFYLSGYSIDIIPKNDNMAIVFDPTKRNTVDDFGSLHSYNCDGYISGYQNICSVYFKDKINIDEGQEYIKKCINDELFIITDKKENQKFLDQISE